MINEEEGLPYVTINQVIEFIRKMPSEVITKTELEEQFGVSRLQNILPTTLLLSLCEYDKKNATVKLTDVGKKFRDAIIGGDEKTAIELIKPVVEKSEVLSFVKTLLDRKGSVSNLEIGRELGFKFNKKWKNTLTYKAYGAASASILDFIGYGVYRKGILKKKGAEPIQIQITPPYASFIKIVKIVTAVFTYGEVDIHTLAGGLETKEGRLTVEIANCIELGFLERPSFGKIAITNLGKEFVDPLNKSKINAIFKQALLNSKFKVIISKLANNTFTIEDLGEILKHELRGKWFEEKTAKTFGRKFLNWLKSACLVKEIENGKYQIINITSQPQSTERLSEKVILTTDYYKLGKAIGIILSSPNNIDEINQAAQFLIDFCKQDKNLSNIVEIIQDHYNFFLELKDKRIFRADIKLIEKALGLEEGSFMT